jgi:hypothetical protein
MQMPMTPEDIVVGVFYQMMQDKKTRLTSDREQLHNAFFLAHKNYPEIMSQFTFRRREFFSESVQLDQALSNLDATGLISRQNLTPKYYQIETPLKKSYKLFSKEILNKAGVNIKDIKKIAQSIEESCT